MPGHEDDHGVDPDKMEQLRTMMDAFLTEEQKFQIFGRKIQPMPNFFYELRDDGGGFPVGVNSVWATKYLRSSFEQASTEPHVDEAQLKEPEYQMSHTKLMQRLRTNDPNKLIGTLIHQEKLATLVLVLSSYYGGLRQSYSNQTYFMALRMLQWGSLTLAYFWRPSCMILQALSCQIWVRLFTFWV
ncbi:unnamed protein product [Cylindrotheca closterium]|uniref:Uncharacterized protein n=1 Tax=Cylindrotheca closterium TaxID=2856 RepID=A0AAD2PXR3_9STRA|nr:unnamed protein product [Cylindrotheca closterium]